MCYFTKKVLNKRFLPNRKNGWNPPVCTDERFRYVEVECGHCFECRKKKRREWRIRNYEQLKETPHAVFFTGTVSPQRYEYICKKYGFKNDGSEKHFLSDYYVTNASFFKMDNITLGYNFDKPAKFISNLRVYGTVQNAFTITKYDGLDPEVYGGIDNNIYPRPRTFLFGVNLTF